MMQSLTAEPRQDLDAALVADLLHADDTRLTATGADLLDLDDGVVEDVSADLLAGGTVAWDGTVDVHRDCDVKVSRDYAWDRDRLRLWCELTSELVGITARFFLGVFVLTSPDQTADGTYLIDPTTNEPWLDPVTGRPKRVRAVKGLDKLHLLLSPVGDTWTADTSAPGASVASELIRMFLAAEYRGRIVIGPELYAAKLTEPMVWEADQANTYLKIANDLLTACGADKLWVDEVGTTHALMLVQVVDRPTEYVLDADDPERTIVGPVRTRGGDLAQIPNAWIITARNWDLAAVDGDGRYRPPANTGDGPTSYVARGRWVRSMVEVDANTQADLVTQGDAIRAADLRRAAPRHVTLGPLPILGHQPLLEVRDAELGDPVRVLGTKWTFQLDGSLGDLDVEEVA